MRMVLLALLFVSASAFAQAPVPDTTAAWRYFPLEVGDVWEYHCLGATCDEYERRSVPSDTFIAGTRYFEYRVERFALDGQFLGLEGTYYLRFDTLTATVESAEGLRPFLTPCPLDAPFGAPLDCEGDPLPETQTSGGLRDVVIGDEVVLTTLKEYATNLDFIEPFVGGIGYEGYATINGGLTLKYARVGGVEYGEPLIAVAEPPAEPERPLALAVYPNPTRGATTLALAVPVPQRVIVEVFDVLGRRVHREAHAASGATPISLDGRAWNAGIYVARVTAADGAQATVRLVRQ